MNERIRQLADEAGLRFTQLMSNPMVPIVDGRETDLAKFAQLIVRECEQVSLKNSHRNDDMGAIIARQIKQHFGVEE
jgi:hypothetical protein